jgi:hypothetical protein
MFIAINDLVHVSDDIVCSHGHGGAVCKHWIANNDIPDPKSVKSTNSTNDQSSDVETNQVADMQPKPVYISFISIEWRDFIVWCMLGGNDD